MKNINLIFLFLLAPFFSFAWSAAGHNTGGAIAYYYLKKNNPVVLQKVLLSFQKHPWYNTRWADTLAKLDQPQKDIALFMLASTWPDEVRKIPEYSSGEKPKWHYINYPYVKSGETITPLAPDKVNAVEKLNELMQTLKSKPEGEAKAIDLCWLFHIMEDLHQPLHTIGLFDVNHPLGDRGGNDTYFEFGKEGNESATPLVLHSYWDRLIRAEFKMIPAYAKKLLCKCRYSQWRLKELRQNKSIEAWVKNESYTLAVEDAYLNGMISGTAASPTHVDKKKYEKKCKKIAERRVVLSGIRLAQSLIELY